MATIKARGAIGAGIAAMTIIATPIYQAWEGNRNMPYKDIVGVWTVCSGDTRNVVPGQAQTPEQCKERTRTILTEYGSYVASVNPSINDYPMQWASHTIFTANIGKAAYSKSSVLRLDLQGHHREACRAMLLYSKAGGKVVIGLQNRRAGTTDRLGEYELCLAEAVERDMGLT